MKVQVHNMQGEVVDEIELLATIFDIEPNRAVMHQALVRQLANARQGTHSTQTRAEVSRTGAKVWRQKGTGRARQGSRRAPHWVGGGVAFGPKPRSYRQAMPKKMRRLAIRSVLAAKAQAGQVVLLDDVHFEQPKTKAAANVLNALGLNERVVLLVGGSHKEEGDENVKQSFRNLPQVKTLHWQYINMRDLLGHEYLLMPVSTLRRVEALWG